MAINHHHRGYHVDRGDSSNEEVVDQPLPGPYRYAKFFSPTKAPDVPPVHTYWGGDE
jgi:hypothetical protein